MPEIDRREFDLLLNEKDHVDGQISSFLDLEIKILTFLFPALGVAIGWMFKANLLPAAKAEILVGAAASACFGILLSIGTYATALAYIYYKTVVLGEKFQEILKLAKPPFETRRWSESPGGKVLNVATGALWLLVFGFTLSLLIAAWCMSTGGIRILVIVCGVLLAGAVVLAMFFGRAILITGKLPATGASNAAGAEARFQIKDSFTARLKPCPSTKLPAGWDSDDPARDPIRLRLAMLGFAQGRLSARDCVAPG